jgi:hypothetical protein
MADERRGADELKDALEQLKKAADRVTDKILGSEVTGHLRAAAQHVVRAARSALDQVDKKMDERGKAADESKPKSP